MKERIHPVGPHARTADQHRQLLGDSLAMILCGIIAGNIHQPHAQQHFRIDRHIRRQQHDGRVHGESFRREREMQTQPQIFAGRLSRLLRVSRHRRIRPAHGGMRLLVQRRLRRKEHIPPHINGPARGRFIQSGQYAGRRCERAVEFPSDELLHLSDPLRLPGRQVISVGRQRTMTVPLCGYQPNAAVRRSLSGDPQALGKIQIREQRQFHRVLPGGILFINLKYSFPASGQGFGDQ